MHKLLVPFLFLLLTACYAEELQQEMEQEPFFDLAGYIDSQVDSLQRAGGTVRKTILLNGQSETQERSDINFSNDLRVFREADINKPSWQDKYQQTVTNDGNRMIRTYVATDSSMQTRRLEVTTIDDRPTSVVIERKTGTVLSDGNHLLTYRPASGYRMRTMQINRFGDDLDALIEVSW